MNDIYQNKPLQVSANAPQVCSSTAFARSNVPKGTKRNSVCRSGNTVNSGRPSVGNHTIFVLDVSGMPLTPTTSAKARKMIRDGKAVKVWSKFNTFGIKLLEDTRKEVPEVVLGYDPGAKFDGASVVCGTENNLSVKWNLPEKWKLSLRISERTTLRQNRRYRNCRRRKSKYNRKFKSKLPPSQLLVVNSRLKLISELYRIYPITVVAMEDVKFNHKKYRNGSYFSTTEIGKSMILFYLSQKQTKTILYRGFQTAEFRINYGYKKTKNKKANKFTAHCSDSLAMAVQAGCGERVQEGLFIVVDDTYRPIRRRLHYSFFSSNGSRKNFSSGNVMGVRKGSMISSIRGKHGQLCGELDGKFRYIDDNGNRTICKDIAWYSNQFRIIKV